MRPLAVIGVLALTLGCRSNPTGPALLIPGARAFTPPAFYRDLWQSVEDCSHLTGSFERVRWFAVGDTISTTTATAIPCEALHGCAGVWTPPHDIYLGGWWAFHDQASHFNRVRHEMLHDLLQGDGDHRSPTWDACLLR